MRAAVVEAFDQPLVSREWDAPTPGAGQILVKTEACGVCHTDLHAARGDWLVKPRAAVRSLVAIPSTAVLPNSYWLTRITLRVFLKQGLAMTRKRGTCVLTGLPPGEFPFPLFDVVVNCITVRGSFVGTR